MTDVMPLPKTNPPVSIEKYINTLTPLAAKVCEFIIM